MISGIGCYSNPPRNLSLLKQGKASAESPWDAQVQPIVEDVRHNGDAAVRSYTKRFDRVDLDNVCVPIEVRQLTHATSTSPQEAMCPTRVSWRSAPEHRGQYLKCHKWFVCRASSIWTPVLSMNALDILWEELPSNFKDCSRDPRVAELAGARAEQGEQGGFRCGIQQHQVLP